MVITIPGKLSPTEYAFALGLPWMDDHERFNEKMACQTLLSTGLILDDL
jgi:hypothetical protein